MKSAYGDMQPQGYSTYGGAPLKGMNSGRSPRTKSSLRALMVCLIAPVLQFIIVAACLSFSGYYTQPSLMWLICALLLVVDFACCYLMYQRIKMRLAGDISSGPGWYTFLAFTMLLSWVLAVVLGTSNYTNNQLPYNLIDNLMQYPNADPASWSGTQLMDAGPVTFIPGSHLDLHRSIGFKNVDQYCVAPITVGTAPLNNYDFWAVGLNCCSGNSADFHCGEFDNTAARSGLRLVREDQRSFYRLAVQQAEATYGIRSQHPVFFFWMQDPQAELLSYKADAVRFYWLGVVGYLALQIFLTVCAGLFIGKLGL